MEVKREVKKDNSFSHSFKDLECWQQAHEFVKAVYTVTKLFPEDELYGLTSQFRRAAVSIAANICEGYRKLSRADKLRCRSAFPATQKMLKHRIGGIRTSLTRMFDNGKYRFRRRTHVMHCLRRGTCAVD